MAAFTHARSAGIATCVSLLLWVLAAAAPAAAQPMGTFTWQLQPFCNRVSVTITQNGPIYTLDGYDDLCGASRAGLVGLATPNPDGTIGFAFHLVAPGGKPVHVEARIALSALSGTWADNAGNGGPFAFAANSGGSPRPLPPAAGDVTGVAAGAGLTGGGASGDLSLAVDAAVIQNRVTGTCAAGQAVRTINQDGSVSCEPVAGGTGDITGVTAGIGLLGGGGTGDVALSVDAAMVQSRISTACAAGTALREIGQNGVATCEPVGTGDITGVTAGAGLSGGGSAGTVTMSVNTTVVQSRVNGTCAAGNAMRVISADGAVTCQATGNGDITDVTVSPGLTGGGSAGPVNIAPEFGGDGTASLIARSDHEHAAGAGVFQNVAVGPLALGVVSGGNQNAALGTEALASTTNGGGNVAIGFRALNANVTGAGSVGIGHSTLLSSTGHSNTAIGSSAGGNLVSGGANTFVGAFTRSASGSLVNATAIGYRAEVGQSNSVVLGSINGINGATADTLVGIGTTSPDALLEIDGNGTSPTTSFSEHADEPTGFPRLHMRRSRGTRTLPTRVVINDVLGSVEASGRTDAEYIGPQAYIRFLAAQSWFSSGMNIGTGTRISFATAPNTVVAPPSERMVIDQHGNVGIGVANPFERLQVFGDLMVGTVSGTGAGSGCVRRLDGSVLAGTCASDARFKRDVQAFLPALDRVAALRPVDYSWRYDDFPDRAFGDARTYGLIAQEVELVLPDLVSTDAQGYKAVDYSKLPLLAIQAIKELKEKNDALERRLAAMEALIAELRVQR
jgi:hypothetical protein